MERDRTVPVPPEPDEAPHHGGDEHLVIRVRREDWEAENPEAQAFLKSAVEQEKRLRDQGLIRGL
jgi:hypothetical protein